MRDFSELGQLEKKKVTNMHETGHWKAANLGTVYLGHCIHSIDRNILADSDIRCIVFFFLHPPFHTLQRMFRSFEENL